MITNPSPQNIYRGTRPARPIPRAANTTEHQGHLATRLTARDRWIVRMVHEHRVLTADQITTLAFPSYRSGRQRLRELYQWSVLDRFQPFLDIGAAPMYYVLGPAGASVLAAEHGVDVKALGYRRERVNGISHHQRLAHTVGVGEWFTALLDHAAHTPDTEVTAWWSETRCARHFGDMTRPDAYGRWRSGRREIEFFLEYDFGTEPLAKVAGKLHGYADLARSTGITTPLLIWLPTARREAGARRELARVWQGVEQPGSVPVATAAADLLDPTSPLPSPADPVWLPVDPRLTTSPQPVGRRGLADLAEHWPYEAAPAVIATDGPVTSTTRLGVLPALDPTPPTAAHARPGGDGAWRRNSPSPSWRSSS